MSANYKAPPIVECVFEFRYVDVVPFETIEKRKDKLLKHYDRAETEWTFQAQFDLEAHKVKQSREPVGLRLKTEDELQIVRVQTQVLAVAQLAPYVGWAELRSRIERDFATYTDLFGRRKITRIGVRYINRIDVPGQSADVEAYLKLYPALPDLGQTVGVGFAMQITQKIDDQFVVSLRSGTAASPVPDTVSFLLDIDLFTEVDIPTRDDQILLLLDRMRELKNFIFESSITDKARALFN
ncbi:MULTISPECIES: TIGR04255 family protein [Sinorhizobium]|nr:TIGR04255 family protein [Sinorhizobium meliloti]WQP21726.1 TIGR04255 family protein [Sinorhizobium meliloti]WQP35142.1 TIGR04255 family protein [Sinorhizobium meliloti]